MEGTLFVNGFLSYLVVYFVFIAAVVIAFVIGFSLRKSKNAKIGTTETVAAEGSGSEKENGGQ